MLPLEEAVVLVFSHNLFFSRDEDSRDAEEGDAYERRGMKSHRWLEVKLKRECRDHVDTAEHVCQRGTDVTRKRISRSQNETVMFVFSLCDCIFMT